MQKFDIVLATLNARYHHTAFGLRYLFANLEELQPRTCIKEFTIKSDPVAVAKEIAEVASLEGIVGFSVYIWNVEQVQLVLTELKARRPDLCLVAGGPEVSYETEAQPLYDICQHIFKGEGDFLFRDFCRSYFSSEKSATWPRIIAGDLPNIEILQFPYQYYSDEDVRHRVIYVEASRGCPYKCEYCLSSLDQKVRTFPIDKFLAEMQGLIDRGARQFKFVDRTFNLNMAIATRILSFFLERIDLELFLHFEMVPDRLPDPIKELIGRFPAGALQFEIGIQTWNPAVARNVSRRQNYDLISENLRYLRKSTKVHTHADLIVGLPGETLASFAAGFDALFELAPDEIQVGILKRLRGAPINSRIEAFGLEFANWPPYQVLRTKDMSSEDIEWMQRFASYWDAIANSGRLPNFMREFVRASQGESMFVQFLHLTQVLWGHLGRTHSIPFDRLIEELFAYGAGNMNLSEDRVTEILASDYERLKSSRIPGFLNKRQTRRREQKSASVTFL